MSTRGSRPLLQMFSTGNIFTAVVFSKKRAGGATPRKGGGEAPRARGGWPLWPPTAQRFLEAKPQLQTGGKLTGSRKIRIKLNVRSESTAAVSNLGGTATAGTNVSQNCDKMSCVAPWKACLNTCSQLLCPRGPLRVTLGSKMMPKLPGDSAAFDETRSFSPPLGLSPSHFP